jgi:hypothetical protein
MKPIRRPRFWDGTPFVALRRPTLDDALVFAPPHADIGPWWPGCYSTRCTQSRCVTPRTRSVLPSSQGTPLCLCPVLRPRSDLHASPQRRLGTTPANLTTKAPTNITFGAQSHGFSTGCLRFVPSSRTTTQNSLPGVANLSGWDFSLPTEFQRRVSAFASSLPELFLARQICNLLYRIAFCGASANASALELRTLCRLQIGDTADYKSALRGRAVR